MGSLIGRHSAPISAYRLTPHSRHAARGIGATIQTMRHTALFLLAAAVTAACTPEEPRPAQARRAVGQDRPELASTIPLPSGDGRVYIISVPGGLSIERSTCVVHVTSDGSHSSTACTPPSINLPVAN